MVVGVTLLFGRIYCSVVCPLGILFDGVSRSRPGRRYRFYPPRHGLRVCVVALILICVVGGSFVFVELFEPFGIFGRSATLMARPLAIVANNGLSRLLEMGGLYLVPPWPLSGIAWRATALAAIILAFLVWLARRRGRLYCNTLCPVGAVLGLCSLGARQRVWFDVSTCTSCGRCSRVCKAECIDSQAMSVDVTRCVVCFNCLDTCPAGSLSYGKRPPLLGAGEEPPEHFSSERRALILSALVTVAPGVRLPTAHAQEQPRPGDRSLTPVVRACPITPPGSRGVDHFTRRCISCLRCVGACPSQVLQPSWTGYGLSGLMMPSLQPRFGYCHNGCNLCGQVCPTGAIEDISLEEKQVTQLGKAMFVRENCIVVLNRTECGACSEHCPTKAVDMVVEKGLRVPVVNPDTCIGCGACEHACPTKPFKAIYVEGNRVHVAAKKPEAQPSKPQDTGFRETTGFPF
ncbi:ferredoxin [Desulfoluna limicola]|uniref:Ferredoxin n=1 Tax=Desulfoluna limicola TaxID=2810562 RepID=A0ABM7PJ90_9BACT|nr:ferredoxin [Desulfoluna limicola]